LVPAAERHEEAAHAFIEQRADRFAHPARAARIDRHAHADRVRDADDLRRLDDRRVRRSRRAPRRAPRAMRRPPATCAVPPPASIASSVPSPPSAIGQQRTTASGRARRMPVAIASATCSAESEPLNESGAMTTTGADGCCGMVFRKA
jgi:hypothetical protein